jgi:hypothetical protein
VYHPDAVAEWPQTGERIRGVANMRAIDTNYPGGLPKGGVHRTLGTGDRYVLDGMFVPRRVTGIGDIWVAEATLTYSSGEAYEFVAILEFRDDRVFRETNYWALQSPAPAWRAEWVEHTR